MRERFSNMLASFRIEGIELDEKTLRGLDLVLSGKITAVELEKQVLAEYLGG